MANSSKPSSFIHRSLRGFLILIALASSCAFVYLSTRHGMLWTHGKRFALSSDVAALCSPVLGIVAVWLAVFVENHERHRAIVPAIGSTFRRLWWMLAFVALVSAWIWVTNRI